MKHRKGSINRRVILSEAKDRFRAKAVETASRDSDPFVASRLRMTTGATSRLRMTTGATSRLRMMTGVASRLRMTRVAALAMGAAVIVAVIMFGRHHADRQRPRTAIAVEEHSDFAVSESEIRDREIAFYERRAAEDTASAGDRSQLAILYMDRARASG